MVQHCRGGDGSKTDAPQAVLLGDAPNGLQRVHRTRRGCADSGDNVEGQQPGSLVFLNGGFKRGRVHGIIIRCSRRQQAAVWHACDHAGLLDGAVRLIGAVRD
jgi:hypothetical protein